MNLPKREEAAVLVKTDLHILEIEAGGRQKRGFVMVHHWEKRAQGTTGATVPIALSREAMEGFVAQLQQALQTAATVSAPPKRSQ